MFWYKYNDSVKENEKWVESAAIQIKEMGILWGKVLRELVALNWTSWDEVHLPALFPMSGGVAAFNGGGVWKHIW